MDTNGHQMGHSASFMQARPELYLEICQEIANLCTFHLEIPNLVPINMRLSLLHWPGSLCLCVCVATPEIDHIIILLLC
jgi:hypothetical protein